MPAESGWAGSAARSRIPLPALRTRRSEAPLSADVRAPSETSF